VTSKHFEQNCEVPSKIKLAPNGKSMYLKCHFHQNF